MGKFILVIVFFFYLAAQVLPRLLTYLAKKQEQQKRTQSARDRDASQFNAPIDPRSTSGQSPPIRPASSVKNPATELAARRQAQLEQLRQRRDQRKTVPLNAPLPQSRPQANLSMRPIPPVGRQVNPGSSGIRPVGRQAPVQPARVAPPNRSQSGRSQVSSRPAEQIRQAPSDRSPGIARVDLEEQRHLEAKRREAAERVVIIQEEKDEALVAARRRAREDKSRLQEMKADAVLTASKAASSAITARQLRGIFADPRQIRAAIVLREILDVPPSLSGSF